jgi:hypothetical protein
MSATGQDAKVLHSPTTRATNATEARRPIQTSKPPKGDRK